MIKINISLTEKQRLIQLAYKELKKNSRDSEDFIIPEYQILKNKIENSTFYMELNPIEAEIICNWIYGGTAGSQIQNPADNT